MKILLSLALAAIPAAVSAQTVSNTLGLVQDLSVSAVSSSDLSKAREDSGKPFNGDQNKPGHGGNSGHNNPPANPPGHNNPGNHPVHPPVVIPHNPYGPGYNDPFYPGYNDPFYPGYNDPFYPGYNDPYYPGNPGYYPGSGHHDTVPVVSGPMSAGAMIIGVIAVAALVLLLVLL